MSALLLFSLITLLIAINALFVAAEFSSISARRSRLAQIASGGNSLAEKLLPIVEDPVLLDRYIATCQLGITISSLLLGFTGLSGFIRPLLERFTDLSEVAVQSISATAALLFLTVLQVILGELVPKNIGIQFPEKLALATSIPTRWSMFLFRPLIWFFNGSGQTLMRLLGLSPDTGHTHLHSPEEILMLVEESEAGGLLNQEERRLLKNTLQLRQSMVRQVMIPRTRLMAAPVDLDCETAMARLAESSFSRLLLYEDSIDNIVGIVHLKDLLCLQYLTGQTDMRAVMRPVVFVPETTPVENVFSMLQREHYYVAIVIDEFGGTAGMVTLKDLVEEIFGEFQDEFEVLSPSLRLLGSGRLQVRGDTLVSELNEWLDLLLPTDEVDTIGGLLLSVSGQVPEVGDVIEIEGMPLRVEVMDGNAVSEITLPISSDQRDRLREPRL